MESENREIEVTWRVDAPELPNQIKKASPQALFSSHVRQDGSDWWVPLKMLMLRIRFFKVFPEMLPNKL